jgi:hypothetical protein
MKSSGKVIIILLFLVLITLIWAPTFLIPALELEPTMLPVSPEVQIQLNLLATSGLVLLVGVFFWIQNRRK